MSEDTTGSATANAALTASTILRITLLIVYYISYPIGVLLYYLLLAIVSLLHLLSRPLAFLLQPFVYLGRFLHACVLFPFQVLVKLETLYIFLSIAAITGLTVGLVFSILSGSLNHLLGLDPSPDNNDENFSSQRRKARQTKHQQNQNVLAVKQYQYRDSYSKQQQRGRPLTNLQQNQQQQNVMTLPEALKSPKSPEHLSPSGGYFSHSSDGAGAGAGSRKGGGRRGRGLLDQTIIEEVDSDF